MSGGSVYVAGAWLERLERARPMIDRLIGQGIFVTHDWTRVEGNERAVTAEQRKKWAEDDYVGVRYADIFWLMAADGDYGCGSWVELGIALVSYSFDRLRRIVVSGANTHRTIFTELATDLFSTDEEAYAFVVEKCRAEGG